MANTYSRVYLHFVFSVKGRENLILEKNKEELQKYITGIVNNRNQKMLSINCMPDHTHLFIGFKPSISISELIQEIKAISSKFINEKKWVYGKFQWQEGYGVFSYSHNQINNVIEYINNQKEHHKRKSFKEEYLEILHKNEIKYDDRYLFDWIELGEI
ncbi:MAG: IS200/IS605 family transposase [Bacteroidales bacterium]|nr:IS200/IS605 family transposase [Bacteroidales bacterium]